MSTASPSTAPAVTAIRAAPAPCAWRNWPPAQRGWRRWVLPAALLATALVVQRSTGRVDWAAAACLLVAMSAWRYFIPVVYELGALGVTRQVLSRELRIPWRAIGRYEVGADGVFLLPHAEPAPLDAFSGLYLPWCGHKDEVMANVEFYLAADGR